jgi:hypothetical protein
MMKSLKLQRKIQPTPPLPTAVPSPYHSATLGLLSLVHLQLTALNSPPNHNPPSIVPLLAVSLPNNQGGSSPSAKALQIMALVLLAPEAPLRLHSHKVPFLQVLVHTAGIVKVPIKVPIQCSPDQVHKQV